MKITITVETFMITIAYSFDWSFSSFAVVKSFKNLFWFAMNDSLPSFFWTLFLKIDIRGNPFWFIQDSITVLTSTKFPEAWQINWETVRINCLICVIYNL